MFMGKTSATSVVLCANTAKWWNMALKSVLWKRGINLPQMRKCKNKQCGKYFEYDPAKKQLYCCSKCRWEANNRKRKRKRPYHKRQPELKPDLNRPYTRDTAYFIHKWHREGMKVEEIAGLLMRSVENVQAALRKPLARGQEKTMEEYLCTAKTPHRDTQGED